MVVSGNSPENGAIHFPSRKLAGLESVFINSGLVVYTTAARTGAKPEACGLAWLWASLKPVSSMSLGTDGTGLLGNTFSSQLAHILQIKAFKKMKFYFQLLNQSAPEGWSSLADKRRPHTYQASAHLQQGSVLRQPAHSKFPRLEFPGWWKMH